MMLTRKVANGKREHAPTFTFRLAAVRDLIPPCVEAALRGEASGFYSCNRACHINLNDKGLAMLRLCLAGAWFFALAAAATGGQAEASSDVRCADARGPHHRAGRQVLAAGQIDALGPHARDRGAEPDLDAEVLEVTPRLRMIKKKAGIDWKTPTLEQQMKGQWVEVTGWLTFDTAHIKQAENTSPGNPTNFRATCWEVHPVTDIKPLDGPPAELASFQPASLTALQRQHAKKCAMNM